MLLILFALLGATAGLVAARLSGDDRELPLDLLAGALGACFGGIVGFSLGGATRPALAVAVVTAVGFGYVVIGVVQVLSDRLALEP